MKYLKPPLTFEQQAELLIQRGLCDVDKPHLLEFLSRVNYYRLSGYLYSFKTIDPTLGEERFYPSTSFITIKQHYEFDRNLRLLLMDAIERIEVAILRTQLVEIHTRLFGPFGYTEYKNYDARFFHDSFKKLLSQIHDDELRSHEEFIIRYRNKYDEETYLPFWMAVELMSYGNLLTIYRNQTMAIRRSIAGLYGITAIVLDSWLLTFNYVRNACAHHVRLWNRSLPVAPVIPDRKHNPDWYSPELLSNKQIFAVLTIAKYLLCQLGYDDQWKTEICNLLSRYPLVPPRVMGFPDKWLESKIWTS